MQFIFLTASFCLAVVSSIPLAASDVESVLTSENINEFHALSSKAQQAVLTKLSNAHMTLDDLPSLHFSPDGEVYVVDHRPAPEMVAETSSPRARRAISDLRPSKFSSQGIPLLSSKPGANNVIYLDFNGHSVGSTNAWGPFSAKPFSLDGDANSFNTEEQDVIIDVWRRVTEDFAPFNVDVTTEEPQSFGSTTCRALITSDIQNNGRVMPAYGAGGVAYLGVFGSSRYQQYSPALVYGDSFGRRSDLIAEVVSHEVGHNMGLAHDGRVGRNAEEYYGGDRNPNDPVSWGPIMGTGYSNSVSQWSKGEYADASNTQDDIAILAENLGFVQDEAGDDATSAASVSLSNDNFRISGIISKSNDVDYYSFSTVSPGSLTVSASPWNSDVWTAGGNLDVKLSLRTANGNILAEAAPRGDTAASLSLDLPTKGQYYLVVEGDAEPGSYSDYASLGQYDIQAAFAPDNSDDSNNDNDDDDTGDDTTDNDADDDDSNDDDDDLVDDEPDLCNACNGARRTSSDLKKSWGITFKTSCNQGHRFNVCFERTDKNKPGAIRLRFQRKHGDSWEPYYKTVSRTGEQSNCFEYFAPASVVTKRSKWRLRVLNPEGIDYAVRFGPKKYLKSNQCQL